MRKQAAIRAILVLSITIAIFYFIFTKIDFYSVIEVLSHANLFYLLIALLLLFTYIPIVAKRWQIILETMGYNLQYKECFNLIMAAFPLTSITPSKSGDFLKTYYLKDKVPASRTIGAAIAERTIYVFSLFLLSLVRAILNIKSRRIRWKNKHVQKYWQLS